MSLSSVQRFFEFLALLASRGSTHSLSKAKRVPSRVCATPIQYCRLPCWNAAHFITAIRQIVPARSGKSRAVQSVQPKNEPAGRCLTPRPTDFRESSISFIRKTTANSFLQWSSRPWLLELQDFGPSTFLLSPSRFPARQRLPSKASSGEAPTNRSAGSRRRSLLGMWRRRRSKSG